MLICVQCEAAGSGCQAKFCSRKCKNLFGNNKHQSYLAQQARGRKRKRILSGQKGSRCQHCGYDRNSSALEFHHLDSTAKSYSLDLRSLSNRKWSWAIAEADKCILLCSNCHREIHNPECEIPDHVPGQE